MRRFPVFSILCICLVTWFILAQNSKATPTYYPVQMSKQVPAYNSEHGLYGKINQVQDDDQSQIPAASGPAQSTVTITAVVLPVRIITIDENTLTVSSNTEDDQSLWYAQKNNQKIPLTKSIWENARACLNHATAQTGTKICETSLLK